MSDPDQPRFVPNEKQLALFRAMEDIHELTNAITILLVDEYGTAIAVSGDENDIPPPIRAVVGGKRLAEAGSVRALLSSVGELDKNAPNVTLFDVDGKHVLAIIFDAECDLMTVQQVGKEASLLLAEILAAPL
jgi:hypothetical protein